MAIAPVLQTLQAVFYLMHSNHYPRTPTELRKTKMPVERIAIFVIGCTALLIVLMLTLRYFF